jgi:hypothetical protein
MTLTSGRSDDASHSGGRLAAAAERGRRLIRRATTAGMAATAAHPQMIQPLTVRKESVMLMNPA